MVDVIYTLRNFGLVRHSVGEKPPEYLILGRQVRTRFLTPHKLGEYGFKRTHLEISVASRWTIAYIDSKRTIIRKWPFLKTPSIQTIVSKHSRPRRMWSN